MCYLCSQHKIASAWTFTNSTKLQYLRIQLTEDAQISLASKLLLKSKVCAARGNQSELCVRYPRIITQSVNPRFAQRNPRMVRIPTLRLTYIYIDCIKRTRDKTRTYSIPHDAPGT